MVWPPQNTGIFALPECIICPSDGYVRPPMLAVGNAVLDLNNFTGGGREFYFAFNDVGLPNGPITNNRGLPATLRCDAKQIAALGGIGTYADPEAPDGINSNFRCSIFTLDADALGMADTGVMNTYDDLLSAFVSNFTRDWSVVPTTSPRSIYPSFFPLEDDYILGGYRNIYASPNTVAAAQWLIAPNPVFDTAVEGAGMCFAAAPIYSSVANPGRLIRVFDDGDDNIIDVNSGEYIVVGETFGTANWDCTKFSSVALDIDFNFVAKLNYFSGGSWHSSTIVIPGGGFGDSDAYVTLDGNWLLVTGYTSDYGDSSIYKFNISDPTTIPAPTVIPNPPSGAFTQLNFVNDNAEVIVCNRNEVYFASTNLWYDAEAYFGIPNPDPLSFNPTCCGMSASGEHFLFTLGVFFDSGSDKQKCFFVSKDIP